VRTNVVRKLKITRLDIFASNFAMFTRILSSFPNKLVFPTTFIVVVVFSTSFIHSTSTSLVAGNFGNSGALLNTLVSSQVLTVALTLLSTFPGI